MSKHAMTVAAERGIDRVWIEVALTCPDTVVADTGDARLEHALKLIPEAGNRLLRVIYNTDAAPMIVVTAFFDRRERRRREGHLR